MRCHRCGRSISPLRQLTDLDFCSENCRKRGARASASLLRDVEFEADPYWQAAHDQANKQQSKASGPMLAMVVAGLVGAMVVARLYFPESGGAAGGPSPLAHAAPTTSPEGVEPRQTGLSGESRFTAWLQRHLPGERPVLASVDFSRQSGDWTGTTAGWNRRDGMVLPGSLRLWTPTLTAKDYEMEFQAAIEKRGVSWVFRAKDSRTFYATKVLLGKRGNGAASILRYGKEGDREFARAELPLPASLQKNKAHRITMLAEGNRFTTLIDGRVVDEWTDSRLRAGGVGFFSEDGEVAGIQWARFREKKGILDRFISANLFLPPAMSF